MSLSRRFCMGRVVVAGLCTVLAVLSVCGSAFAQSDSNPKWDLFAGYQWLHPGGTTPTPFNDPANPVPFKIPDMNGGLGSTLTYNVDPHWGISFDFGHNWGKGNYESTGSFGPRFMWRSDQANYFLHTLLSYNRLAVGGLHTDNGIGVIMGGGMDLPINKWFQFRLFEADYVWGRHNYAEEAAASSGLRHVSLEGVRLRTGIVLSWGGAPELVPAATCSIQPSEVFVGEPLTATASATNFNPKHTVAYSWSGNGGQVTGKDTTASIDTTNAAPGSYSVTAKATDARVKKNNEASCSANYTVKAIPPKNPPTVSISANPASVVVGNNISLTANCTSPDSVPVSVGSWTASGGSVSGSGSSATLSTNGVQPGSVTVGATCTDSRGLTGQATAQVQVQTPPPPPIDKEVEARLTLGHSVYFATAMPPVKDPNAGLIASQQATLVELAADFQKYIIAKPDAHLILEGHADPRGGVAYNQALSERRVARVKAFLVEHGIPDTSIETQALGDQHNLTADEVKESVEGNPNLSSEERARILRNSRTVILASNRRVDVRLSTTGQVSKRQFPFNAADALTLLGGRTPVKKAPAGAPKAAPKKAPAKKK